MDQCIILIVYMQTGFCLSYLELKFRSWSNLGFDIFNLMAPIKEGIKVLTVKYNKVIGSLDLYKTLVFEIVMFNCILIFNY